MKFKLGTVARARQYASAKHSIRTGIDYEFDRSFNNIKTRMSLCKMNKLDKKGQKVPKGGLYGN